MTPAQKAARRLLETVIPDNIRDRITADYGLHLHPGATYGDALAARKRQLESIGETRNEYPQTVHRSPGL